MPSRSDASVAPPPILDKPWKQLDEVILGMAAIEAYFFEAQDRRAIFATAYVNITRELKGRIDAGRFNDPPWVTRYVIAFANLYRSALAAFVADEMVSVPKAWQLSFETAKAGTAVVVQDLVLAINAHINHDLPVALLEVGVDPDRESRYADHTAINDALRDTTALVEDRVTSMYAPALSILGKLAEGLIEGVTNFSFEKAREAAWAHGLSLINARSGEERRQTLAQIDDTSSALGRLVLASVPANPALHAALKLIERVTPWWSYVTLAEIDTGPPAPPAQEPLVVSTIDGLIELLDDTVQRFDSERSRLSIYPSTYVLFTREVERKLKAGDYFEDNVWMTQLDLHFATQYFRALEHFEAGQLDRVPRCWAIAFGTSSTGAATVLQDLVLAVNARLNHDLPIALLRAGITDDTQELCRRDLFRMHDVFVAEFDPVQHMLADKYSEIYRAVEMVAGGIERFLADLNYTRARDSAWENGLALAQAASEEQRSAMILELDVRSTALAQTILLKEIPGGPLLTAVLRHVESLFPGKWSEWVQPA